MEIRINGNWLRPPNGFVIVAAKPKSLHPADNFLFTVLCEKEMDCNKTSTSSHVIWTYNSSDHGFHNGLYILGLEKAFKAFGECGV